MKPHKKSPLPGGAVDAGSELNQQSHCSLLSTLRLTSVPYDDVLTAVKVTLGRIAHVTKQTALGPAETDQMLKDGWKNLLGNRSIAAALSDIVTASVHAQIGTSGRTPSREQITNLAHYFAGRADGASQAAYVANELYRVGALVEIRPMEGLNSHG